MPLFEKSLLYRIADKFRGDVLIPLFEGRDELNNREVAAAIRFIYNLPEAQLVFAYGDDGVRTHGKYLDGGTLAMLIGLRTDESGARDYVPPYLLKAYYRGGSGTYAMNMKSGHWRKISSRVLTPEDLEKRGIDPSSEYATIEEQDEYAIVKIHNGGGQMKEYRIWRRDCVVSELFERLDFNSFDKSHYD